MTFKDYVEKVLKDEIDKAVKEQGYILQAV